MVFKELENLPVWDGFLGTLSLAEMGKVKLMNRVDTKYVMPAVRLEELLEMAAPDYYVQKNDGYRVARYDTIYYDTDDCRYYIIHQNKKSVRQKLRTRQYVHSGVSFLEVKNKNNRGRTKKKRIEIGREHNIDLTARADAMEFLEGRLLFPVESLSRHLRTRFDRITLVNREKTERVTIDVNLGFENFRNGAVKDMPGIAIVEIKQDGTSHSTMKDILTRLHIHRLGFSKYCIGSAVTRPDLKQNNFKERLITVKNIEKNAQFTSSNA